MEKNNRDIDLDELDELPDVVLGDKTRAFRLEREGNGKARLIDSESEKKEERKQEPKPASEDFAFTRSLNTEDVRKEESQEEKTQETETVTAEQEKTKPVLRRRQFRSRDISEDDFDRKLDERLSSGKKEEEQEKTQTIEDPVEESPASIIDDDPGVEDELSSVYDKENREDDNATAAVTQMTDNTPYGNGEENTEQETAVFDTDRQTTSQLVYEEPEKDRKPVRKKRHRHSVVHTIVVVLLVILLILLSISLFAVSSAFKPVSDSHEEVVVTVADGESLPSVTEKLQSSGVIRNDQIAYLYAKFRHYDSYTSGDHVFYTDMTLDQVFDELAKPTDNENVARVTIIEGDWAKDIAAKFAEKTNVSADELLSLWNNPDWIRSKMSDYPFLTEDMFADGVRIYLEGYLAPDTYETYRQTTAEDITCRLLDQSLVVYNRYKDDIAKSGHSIHDIYTMASIIQYEAGTNPDDLAKVASVFYNRMKAGMDLGSSVTVCYAIDFDSQTDGWQACELNSDYDSPYNTYLHEGLPPGAIENAGETAINAAIHPADTDYYYFMADVCGDGTVHYAKTLEEHNANVNKYLSDVSNGCN